MLKVIQGQKKDLGDNFVVRRSFPTIGLKNIGPFIFWDHMGPAEITEATPMLVRSHPHIGLATLTYLTQGEILHRDSLGHEQVIRPGEVNWMTAGSGIVHSERSHSQGTLEGIQLWIALPAAKENISAAFEHYTATDIPRIAIDDQEFTLIAGEYQGKASPVAVYSPLAYIASEFKDEKAITFEIPASWEFGLYVLQGTIEANGSTHELGTMVVVKDEETLRFTGHPGSHVLLLGGQPLNQPIHMWWNFVSTDQEKIRQAAQRWKQKEFPNVIQEDPNLRIPLPES